MRRPTVFRPVRAGGNWRLNAVVERHDDHELATGFAAVAELIIEHWIARGPNDLLFEPLVYNHRHALELVLKSAIRETARRLRADGHTDTKVDEGDVEQWLASRSVGHNLHKLVGRLDLLLRRLGLEQLPPDTHTVLMAIHELDPNGESFRYAKVKKNGEFIDAPRPLLHGPNDLQAHVDIAAMHEHFRGLFALISDGVMSVLEEYADFQEWMQSEAQP